MAGVRVSQPGDNGAALTPEIDTEPVVGADGVERQRQVIRAVDVRLLAERMFAKAPQEGYSLWLDLADVNHMYFAEAPVAADGTALTFQGIRVPIDLAGNILGKVQTAVGFAWNARKDAAVTTWT